ncbi:unnamed protein product [Mytilus coruscus]|uniref:Endonuclease/exonuclease/phosphatase domain-containing protein n=1 Tax=Mytilus coruscus TaxID=42192 RepID=A0A6J8BPV5_MYTCO|nr:unnamed protein product [Mytilus coruscus]
MLTTEACSKGYSHILIMGDYNFPEINWDSWNSPGDSRESNKYKFLENLQENFLFQHVTRPTRWRGTNTPHTLDLILTNEEQMISNLEYQSPLGKSDHCTMKFDFNCYTNIKKKAKENPKAIWSYIKSKTKTKEGIGDLHIDPEDTKTDKTEDNSTKPKILVDYFSSVFTNEPDGEVPTPNQVPVINEILKQKIKEEVVLKHLSALKIDKSPGMDKIHPRLLKEIAESIAKPLCIIFNQSLENKTVPNDWKNAMISAIFQKGNKSLAKNYRPVSLTSVVCKIMDMMEKIFHEFIIEHMKTNNLFSKKQYGFFIAGRSTGLHLLEVIDKWTEALDQGFDVDCIYTDFMKAFDKPLYDFKMTNSAAKTLLKNYIRHVGSHNKIVEEAEMWKEHHRTKEFEKDKNIPFFRIKE